MHVVLLAHGSRDRRHAFTVRAIADGVARASGWQVDVAFLDLAPPTLADAVKGAPEGEELVVAPLLLTLAFHARVDVPAAVDLAREARPDLALVSAAPLGPDVLLVRAMEQRVTEAGAVLTTGTTAVLVVAAGSSDSDARAEVADLGTSWFAGSGVSGAHAFASGPGPQVADEVQRLARSGADRVVVAPFLLTDGVLPELAFAEAQRAGEDAGVDVVIAGVIGAAPEVVELVRERVREATRANRP